MNEQTSDLGSTAVELLSIGILVPSLIVRFGLGALAVQRSALAAQQLAREGVRLAALGDANAQARQDLRQTVANELDLHLEQVKLQLRSIIVGGDGFARAEATVNGQTETAQMRIQ